MLSKFKLKDLSKERKKNRETAGFVRGEANALKHPYKTYYVNPRGTNIELLYGAPEYYKGVRIAFLTAAAAIRALKHRQEATD